MPKNGGRQPVAIVPAFLLTTTTIITVRRGSGPHRHERAEISRFPELEAHGMRRAGDACPVTGTFRLRGASSALSFKVERAVSSYTGTAALSLRVN
jgi:hypothetical protein